MTASPTTTTPQTRRGAEELKALAEQGARELEGASAQVVARWAAEHFGHGLGL